MYEIILNIKNDDFVLLCGAFSTAKVTRLFVEIISLFTTGFSYEVPCELGFTNHVYASY